MRVSMARKATFFLLGVLVLASSHVAQAQQQKTVARIGWLSTRPAAREHAIRRELHRLGWIEGQNIAFENRFTEGFLDRLPALANELVQLKVDAILTTTTPATRAAKNATRTIPVIFSTSGDPVISGLVDSLARPGGNLTGFTAISPVIAGPLIPGDPGREAESIRSKDGIPLLKPVVDDLWDIARKTAIPFNA
jgi:putative tryptophan/tyrosine transport system substrate-binding protein